jgi:CRP/FNR family transcriptional regulator, cyclic AMP receptor protein
VTTTDAQKQYITLLVNSGEATQISAGDTVFTQGDPGDQMYVVKTGSVLLRADGREVETVGAGGLFGEMAVVDREPRSATALAETNCELVAIDKRRFWFLVQETPYFAEIVMRVMVDRLRRQNAMLVAHGAETN